MEININKILYKDIGHIIFDKKGDVINISFRDNEFNLIRYYEYYNINKLNISIRE